MPPAMWANCEIESSVTAANTSRVRYIRTTRTKVSGISPERMFVNELSRIIMKTMPLAPIRPVDRNSTFRPPVASAVIAIIPSSGQEPYFSSRIGPIRSINAKLASRCAQLACPSTCVINRR